MPHNLDSKQQAIRDEVTALAQKEIAPRVRELDQMPEPRRFPTDIYRKLGEAGFIGLDTQTEYGGRGKSFLEFVTMIEHLSYEDVAFGLTAGIARLLTFIICKFGSEEHKRQFVPDCATGRKIAALAMTEPDFGSDAASMRTTAVEDGSDYVINGEKIFITHGDVAETVMVLTRIEGQPKISAIMVDPKQPGYQPRTLTQKMGARASNTAYVKLANVRAPKANLVGEIGKGFPYAMLALDGARANVAAQSLGVAQRALDESVAYARKRVAFGAPIAKLQAIQWMIADMATRVEASRLLTYKAAQLHDDDQRFSVEAAQAKLFAAETANFCVDRAMQIHGGYGYIGEFSMIEKLYRDQRYLEIGEGTSEIQRLVIAGSVIGKC